MKAVRTNCAYCGVGCGILMKPIGQNQWKAVGDKFHPANKGLLCAKGASLGETLGTGNRVKACLIDGQVVSPKQATAEAAHKLQDAIATYGSDSVAFYVSGQLLTEDYYVANKFVKGFLGTSNIDTNSRLCMASTVVGHKRAFGEDVVPGSYEDLDHCDLAIVVGSNMSQCHPVLFQRMMQRSRPPYLIVIDPRKTATSEKSDLHLAISPGTDIPLFNGLLRYIIKNGGIDEQYVESRLSDCSEALLSVSEFTVSKVARFCQIPEQKILDFYSKFLQFDKTVTLFSQGINQSANGSNNVSAILNVHLITGRVGKVGSSPFSLTGQFNAMGGREVGGLANQLVCHRDFDDKIAIEQVRKFWNAKKMADHEGLKAVDLFKAAASGKIKFLWIMATNPIVSMPNRSEIEKALRTCDTVVVSEAFETSETLKFATIVLPAATWGEKDGTTTNSDRTISRQRSFLKPTGEVRQDWQWVCAVAERCGYGDSFSYNSSAEIFSEYAKLCNTLNSAGNRLLRMGELENLTEQTYETLEPLKWPVEEGRLRGRNRVFSTGEFSTFDAKGKLYPVDWSQCDRFTEIQPPSSFLLNTGRAVNHWHTMTRTSRAPSLYTSEDGPVCFINPKDYKHIKNTGGQDELYFLQVSNPLDERMRSIYRVVISEDQQVGQIFIPFHWSDNFASESSVNRLTSGRCDPFSGQPAFKQTLVNLTAWICDKFGVYATKLAALAPPPADWWQQVEIPGYRAFRFALRSASFTSERFDKWLKDQISSDLKHTCSTVFNDESRGEISAVNYGKAGIEQYIFLTKQPRIILNDDHLRLILCRGFIPDDTQKSQLLIGNI